MENVIIERGKLWQKKGSVKLEKYFLMLLCEEDEMNVSYSLITSLEKIKSPISSTVISVVCRHFLAFRIIMNCDIPQANSFFDGLAALFPDEIENSYAFSYTPLIEPTAQEASDSWNVFDIVAEYKRMGLGTKTDKWRISYANKNFSICKTYPKAFAVPAKISDNVILHAAKFRTKGRIPVLSYIHSSNLATITRSSQPLVGLKQKRSIQDEKMIEAIFESNNSNTSEEEEECKRNLIMDARPHANAVVNRAMGAGFESTQNYKGCKRLFMGIENIHVMRDSLSKLIDAIQEPDMGLDKWYSLLDASEWLKHIRIILDAVHKMVRGIVEDAANILVHCSDGWDRTAQLSGLAQICLDPYFRTTKGLQVLIEKEWVSFGHKFGDRCGHFAKNPRSSHFKESSPVFHQFLECIWQIMQQFPNEFEYNHLILLDIFEHVYSCQFGNFLLNCERDRDIFMIQQKTCSIWWWIDSRVHLYRNSSYTGKGNILVISSQAQHVRFWTELYCRWDV